MIFSKYRPIILISAVPSEGNLFVKKMGMVKKDASGPLAFHTGRSMGRDIIYSAAGLGKTNAAHAATRLILKYVPAFVISFGIGGAYPSSGLKKGELAVATKEIYADEGVILNNRFETLETIGIPLVKISGKRYFNEFPLDNKLAREAIAAGLRTGTKVKPGVFATVSSCTGTKKRALEISSRFNAICENMEGAAIAHICCLYKIPCIEIRGISNIVEARDVSKWDIDLAAENCQKALIELFSLPEISRWTGRNRPRKKKDK